MKILIVDKFERWGIDQLKTLAEDVVMETGLKGDALAARIAEYKPDALIVRSTKINADALSASDRLRVVVRAGSGVDNIDLAAASKRGVMVSNCPGMNSVAVAELVMGLIVALDRRIPDNVIDFRAGKWNKKEYSKALGLKGRTLGVVGAGQIGSEVAARALACEMELLYYHLGRQRRLQDFPHAKRVELDDLLKHSDYVTVHVPGGEGTTHVIDERRLGMLKTTAVLINTSRASVIDEKALVQALRTGRIRAAALDVFENEPPADGASVESPLRDVPNLYVTHHIGASTEQAQLAVAAETVRIVAQYKASGKLPNCVNLQVQPRATCLLIVRFANKPGGLAHVFNHIAREEINVEEMDHVVYDGGHSACAQIRLDRHPSADVLNTIRTGHPNVLGVELMEVSD
ncbi:MAG: phosphoglycerate dehydrogenase [Phycisphaerae bacterium]